MNRNARNAYNALKKIGAPVLSPDLGWGGHFAISGELYGADDGFYEGAKNLDPDGNYWYDYYESYWGSPYINDILEKHGLFAEWINAGVLGVYDA
jgi:hypothetical protein